MTEISDIRKWYVYKHTSPSNKVYIGVTSQNPNKRWRNGKGYKNNQYFSRAIDKYGWDNFEHEILYEEINKETAYEKEKELILFYNSSNPKYGYNMSTGGEGGHEGATLSDEAKQKISNANKGRQPSKELRQKQSKRMLGENNPFYGDHHTEDVKQKLSEYQKRLWANNEYKQNLIEKRKGLQTKENNPMYGKNHSNETKNKISESLKGKTTWMKGRHHTEETKEKLAQLHKKEVMQFDKNINYITTYDSVTDAEKATGISRYNISGCCRCEHQTAGGFIWIYKQDYESNPKIILSRRKTKRKTNGKVVNQYNINGDFIKAYSSVLLASQETGISKSSISACCRGSQQVAGNFIWRYNNE